MAKRCRGDAQMLMLSVLASVLLAVGTYIVGYQRGDSAGADRVQVQWDKKALEDVRFAAERDADRDKRVLEVQQEHRAASARADQAQSELEEAKREARRNGTRLAACQVDGANQAQVASTAQLGRGLAPGGGGQAGVARDRSDRVVLTWEFVRQFDAAWTGLDGKSLSDLAAGGDWAGRAGAPAPYGPEDVVDVAEANAIRCSADRREFAALITKIERAAAAFDEALR